jgi:hypothetical protein
MNPLKCLLFPTKHIPILSALLAVGSLYSSASSRTSDLSKSPIGNRIWRRVSKGQATCVWKDLLEGIFRDIG